MIVYMTGFVNRTMRIEEFSSPLLLRISHQINAYAYAKAKAIYCKDSVVLTSIYSQSEIIMNPSYNFGVYLLVQS